VRLSGKVLERLSREFGGEVELTGAGEVEWKDCSRG
jgi:hypothetical protein